MHLLPSGMRVIESKGIQRYPKRSMLQLYNVNTSSEKRKQGNRGGFNTLWGHRERRSGGRDELREKSREREEN